jgi:hypothetical protein
MPAGVNEHCDERYLYSHPIEMPGIPNTDFLFAASAANGPSAAANVSLRESR